MSIEAVGFVRGALTALLSIAFIALWIWSWSKQRKADFDAAARLPLEEPVSGSRLAVSETKSDPCSAHCRAPGAG